MYIVVGVGQWRKQDEINLLASDPKTTHAFLVEDYDSLSFIEAALAKKTCTGTIVHIRRVCQYINGTINNCHTSERFS